MSESQPYTRGAYHRIVDSFYKDSWLDGATTFADGTKVIWNITDLVKNSNKTKRNPRGKTKHKTKQKYRTIIQLQAALHKKKYRFPIKIKDKTKEQSILTKSTKDYDWIKIRRSLAYPNDKTFSVSDFIQTIAIVYRQAYPLGGNR